MTFDPARDVESQHREGMLVDGEFIPLDIWLAHLPVAMPPGTTVTPACPVTEGDHYYEPEYPEDAGRWVFRCQECGAISENEVPRSMRRRLI